MNLQKMLSEKRYNHSLQVAKTAQSIALSIDPDLEEAAFFAGYWHDCAKELSEIENQTYKKMFPTISNVELHGYIAAYLVEEKLGYKNQDLLNAIRHHTVPHEHMSVLEQIIYVADKCEPTRGYEHATEIRNLAHQDIHQAFKLTVKYAYYAILEKHKKVENSTLYRKIVGIIL